MACRLGDENEGWNIIRTLLANERAQVSIHEEVDRGLDRLFEDVRGATSPVLQDDWTALVLERPASAVGQPR